MSTPTDVLASVLTPALFSTALELRIPFDKRKPVDPSAVRTSFFGGGFDTASFRKAVLPALKQLATIGLDAFPESLLPYLPPPTAASFPEQAFGLIIVLDQGPRQCFDGMDDRWTSAYFDVLVQALLAELRALPADQQPWTKERWLHDVGADESHWFLASFWWAAPLVHSEELASHEAALALTAHVRHAVRTLTGDADPYPAPTDPLAFFRTAMARCPPAPLALSALVYWMLMLIETHTPIVRTFGRYPYRNGALGREDTEAERAFMEQTSGFAGVEADVRKRIAEDVRKGRWTPIEATV
jgi:uncharacterized protein (DUF924 family)